MRRLAHFAIAAFGMTLTVATADAAPFSAAAAIRNVTSGSISAPIHLKPGNHCHPHGHGKLCHGPNDYPALYPRAERQLNAPHRHTRLCRH
ncbi:MAG: hypothetical protein Q7T86_06335 [Hyphomicrobiaceae bacterium]|nr:hypothetical protein [Hyphomicrobiaceae bacterium]